MAMQPAPETPLLRCPQCMHPVAPGPGVPTEPLGRFAEGIGADCNECGTVFPPGTRLIVGGSGTSDDPHRSLRNRWTMGVLVGIPTAIGAVGLGWVAFHAFRGARGSNGMVIVAVICLVGAIACATALYRKAIMPLRVAASGRTVNNRSAWLVGGEHFLRFSPKTADTVAIEDAGRLLGVSVRSWRRRHGTPEHFVAMHAVDSLTLGKAGSPDSLPRMLRNLLQTRPAFLGPATQPRSPMGGPSRPKTLPAPALKLRIAGSDPASTDEATTVRTLARACMGEADAAGEARLAISGATHPSGKALALLLAGLGVLVGKALLVVAAVACLVFGTMKMVSDGGDGSGFGIMFGVPLVCIMAASLLNTLFQTGIGIGATTRWEASDTGLLIVDTAKDGRQALALGIPARTLARIAPSLACSDEGDGECTVQLACGEVIIKQITLKRSPGAALDEVKRLLRAVPTPAG